MSESLFTSQTPSSPDLSDGVDYSLGTVFQAAVNGSVSAIRWYFPTNLPSGTVTCALYSWTTDTTGTLLASGSFSSPSAGAWNQASITPQAITAGTYYVAVIHTPDRYVATAGLFSSALTNGNLTAPADDGVTPRHNGKFLDTVGSIAYPTGSFGAGGYFVDVVFDASAGTNAPAESTAVTVSAPAPTVAVAPAGGQASVTVAAQDPTVSVSPAAGQTSVTVAANDATIAVAPAGGLASVTAAALDAQAQAAAAAALGAVTAAANDSTIAVYAQAGLASVAVSAPDPGVTGPVGAVPGRMVGALATGGMASTITTAGMATTIATGTLSTTIEP